MSLQETLRGVGQIRVGERIEAPDHALSFRAFGVGMR